MSEQPTPTRATVDNWRAIADRESQARADAIAAVLALPAEARR